MARRRGNGEGSISERADGRWMGRYTVETPTGPKRKSRVCPDAQRSR
jgi:hypothetical protein